jgi:hypothetical protein
MNAFKRRCIVLRKQDYTLPEIMVVTGRSKGSIYFHIRGIPLSDKKRIEINKANAQRAIKIAGARKGISVRPFKRFNLWDKKLVSLVAHLLFDGEISRVRCVYNNRSQTLLTRVESLMQEVYAYEPRRYINQKTGVKRISYNNVALAAFLKEKSKELLERICTFPLSFQREFLRAFFDDEGCMDFRPQRNLRRVRGYQKDKTILSLVQTLLGNFGMTATLQGKNEVVISGKENLLQFQKEIGFSLGVRINGNRSNSIWKKSLEKRDLLQNAINSFRNTQSGRSNASAPAPVMKRETEMASIKT